MAFILVVYVVRIYGTAQFKLEACVRVTRVCFVAPLEYFSKSCVSVDNCTGISRAIHAPVTSPYLLECVRTYVHASTSTLGNFDRYE